ncbi:transposase (ISmav2) [Legionella steigerwaltii]|uniref:Transposase (ISmav2) n=1 Tax=Legionella steigerwaltii TaxID=460 RepID=A0A378LIU6_9GAMM|nr:helix-turn-helix domain-containing protein [Legionella steigerwaltii]KTD70277.1 transposase (ISmav2) [Legionella steigerwaltii]STY24011.1 transposase (ISmav2) [Legionella steigerwaltii]
MDEKIKFVARLLDGEQMSSLCQEFGISRKTGYKIYDRYKESGLEGLNGTLFFLTSAHFNKANRYFPIS